MRSRQFEASSILWLLGSGLLAVVGTWLAFARLPSELILAMILGLALLLLVPLLPLRVVVLAWGAILPVWSVGSLDPQIFDAARLVGALVVAYLAVRSRETTFERGLRSWIIPIGLLAVVLVAYGLVRQDASGQLIGRTILVSLVVSAVVVGNIPQIRPLLVGYVAGSAVSATVLILQYFGISFLAPQADPGLYRATGLAPSSTLVSHQLAAAILVSGVLLSRRRAKWPLPVILVLTAALLLCGGRGGLLDLTAAGLVAAWWGWLRAPQLLAIAGALWAGNWFAARSGVVVNTLERFDDTVPYSGDLTNGRAELVDEAVRALLHAPVFGPGVDNFFSQHGSNPHTAILLMGLGGGVLGALMAGLLMLKMLRGAVRRGVPPLSEPRVGPLLMAACLMWSLVEPTGPFLGVLGLTLILSAARDLAQKDRQGYPGTV